MNIIFNQLLAQLVKYDVHITRKIKFIHAIIYHIFIIYLIICPIAIAYSMGQIIKSVCVCVSVCLSVCPSASTLTVAYILDRFSPKLAQT